jgi:hypothetical protein
MWLKVCDELNIWGANKLTSTVEFPMWLKVCDELNIWGLINSPLLLNFQCGIEKMDLMQARHCKNGSLDSI